VTKSPGAETTTVRLRCADVPPGEAVVVAVRDDLKVAVFQLEDGYWAIDNRCPHRGGQIGASGGYVYRGTTVVCPWHGYRIDLQTGCFLDHPEYRSRVFPVVREGDEVVVTVSGDPPGSMTRGGATRNEEE